VSVVSDELTLDMISGSKIVYKEEMIRSAFEVVDNPMAEGGCSCGTSFTPKS
jgi:Fe-S cluster assembly iron-binding protein IscA